MVWSSTDLDIKISRAKGSIPSPLPDGYTVVGFDESGFFPAKRDETGDRFKRMILYAAMSNNPADGARFRDGSVRSVYTRESKSWGDYSGVWAELNRRHSRVPELLDRNMPTRIISVACLISIAGYDGSLRTSAVVDRFWPAASDGTFFAALNYFGVYPEDGTITVKACSDKHVPIVREAHEKSKRIWSSSTRHEDYGKSRIDIPPELVLACMMDLEKHGINMGLLRDLESYGCVRPN